MYNISKKRESLLFSNKMNKLVSLVRKARKEDLVDELVYEIDQEIINKMKNVQQKLQFVTKQNNEEI